jgi:ABC-type branched-subunit amino acid transport system ATPase component
VAAILEAVSLFKSFGGVRALSNFSFRLEAGETLAVIGPNGAGKTTLFNVLSGAERADRGRILMDGRDVSRLGPERRAREGLARSFQAGTCFANLSVMDNLLVGAHASRIASRAGVLGGFVELAEALLPLGPFRREESGLRLRAKKLAAEYGDRIAPRLEDPAYSLSYANRRRLEIARALASKPRILLLDEPTAGMNPSETEEMIGFLAELKASGIAMLVIEHKLPLVMRLADRAIVMDEGESIAEGEPAAVAKQKRVVEAYLGRRAEASVAQRALSPQQAPAAPAPTAKPATLAQPTASPMATPTAQPLVKSLLRLESIDSFYGPVQVHHGLSLEVGEGEIVCLLGGNASGKSTAMKIVTGLMKPRSGEVLWRNDRITSLPTPGRIALGIAFVPEARRIFPDMTVEENILMGAYVLSGPGRPASGAARGAARGRAAELRRDEERVLELFPRLAERLGQAGGTLSGGEQQMLAIARALMSRPSLVCMDEPTMGLSPLYVERVLETVAALNREGVSVFMVEQNAHQALGIAHRGYVLQNGRLVLQGLASELLGDPRIRDAYLGSETMSGI